MRINKLWCVLVIILVVFVLSSCKRREASPPTHTILVILTDNTVYKFKGSKTEEYKGYVYIKTDNQRGELATIPKEQVKIIVHAEE